VFFDIESKKTPKLGIILSRSYNLGSAIEPIKIVFFLINQLFILTAHK